MKVNSSGFVIFEDENQVDVGTAVILKVEAESRGAACSPFATMLVEKIERGDTPEENVYHMSRPYLRLDRKGALVARHEPVKIKGFKRFSESMLAHNFGDNRPYVMVREDF